MFSRLRYVWGMWILYALGGIVVMWLVIRLFRSAVAREVADRPMSQREREMAELESEEWPGGPSERERRRNRPGRDARP